MKPRFSTATGGAGFPVILVLLPEYDDVTRAMAEFARDISGDNVVILRGDRVRADTVATAIEAMQKERDLIVIFVGHGDFGALLTDPKLGLRSELHLPQHSILFDEHAASRFRGLQVFAYSCRSARDLGEEVSRRAGVFLGFEGLISFPFAEEGDGLDPHFREPLLIVSRAVREGRGLDMELLIKVQAYYLHAIEGLKGQRDEQSDLVRQHLRRHLKLLTLKRSEAEALAS